MKSKICSAIANITHITGTTAFAADAANIALVDCYDETNINYHYHHSRHNYLPGRCYFCPFAGYYPEHQFALMFFAIFFSFSFNIIVMLY